MSIFKQFDGTGREPREAQRIALNFIEQNLDTRVMALNCPTGSGKSFISRAIQLAIPRTRIATVSNNLVDQFSETYPQVRGYKGMSNYKKYSDYLAAQDYAVHADNSIITNPLALYFLSKRRPDYEDSDVLVLDEADQILGLVQNLCSTRITLKYGELEKYGLRLDPEGLLDMFLINILRDRAEAAEDKANQWLDRKSMTRASRFMERADSFGAIADTLEFERERIGKTVRVVKQGKVKMLQVDISPVRIPSFLMRRVFGEHTRIILLSGTLFSPDLTEVFPTEKVSLFSVPSPIAPERRQVRWSPLGVSSYVPSPLDAMAAKIERILSGHPDLRPCLIHATYSDALPLSEKLKTLGIDCLVYNEKDKKGETVERWKSEGGVIIAPGLSTGVDLLGNLCRLNIITKLQFPSLTDDLVVRRKLLDSLAYSLSALRHVIQAAGRSSRSADDFSIVYVLDDRFPRLRWKLDRWIPSYFSEAIDPRAYFTAPSS